MLKLKRLKILHYRNVAPGSELRFDDGLNLVLGVNASGKTTLLALLSAVCRSVFEGLKHEEFELEYELVSARFRVEVRVSHRQEAGTAAGPVGGPIWDDHYAVTYTEMPSGMCHRAVSGDSETTRRIGLFMDWSLLAALLSNSEEIWSEARAEIFASLSDVFRLDESLDGFAAMTGRLTDLRGPESPPRAHVGWRRAAKISMSFGKYVPSVLSQALSLAMRDYPKEDITLRRAGEELTEILRRHLGVAKVAMEPNIAEKRGTRDESSLLVLGFSFEITRPDGTMIHHDRLSYGQKRLLSFFYYLACNPAVVIADELVNGLHHRWIDACMKEIGSRQAFLTSQNPLLFDYAEFESVEQVQRRFLVCGLEVVEGREMMVWRNMSREDAEVFYRAYEAGIEHVGDILITRGLW